MITWPRVVLVISGTAIYLVNWKKDKRGFLLLAFSACGWAIYDYELCAYEQAFMMLGNAGIGIISFWKWWHDEHIQK